MLNFLEERYENSGFVYFHTNKFALIRKSYVFICESLMFIVAKVSRLFPKVTCFRRESFRRAERSRRRRKERERARSRFTSNPFQFTSRLTLLGSKGSGVLKASKEEVEKYL